MVIVNPEISKICDQLSQEAFEELNKGDLKQAQRKIRFLNALKQKYGKTWLEYISEVESNV